MDSTGHRINRRAFSGLSLALANLGIPTLSGADAKFDLLGPSDASGEYAGIIHAPSDRSKWPAWREQLTAWRGETRNALNLPSPADSKPEFDWVKSAFVLGFLPMWDYRFYNPVDKEYPIGDFLDQGEKEFGGYDILLLWPGYPRLGFDRRNQFDYYRDVPGGFEALREISQICRQRNTRVMIAYLPWDTGTRRPEIDGAEKDDAAMIADLVKTIEADGVFLDTLASGAQSLREQTLKSRPGVLLESELKLPLDQIETHHASWAQWFQDSHAPGVLRNKWIERGHMQHQIHRWNQSHHREIHSAWMNGSGIVVWENVFGTWNGWSQLDKTLLRMIAPVLRRYVDLFTGGHWTPLVETRSELTFASLWNNDALRLWTMVNSSEQILYGGFIAVPHVEGDDYYDVIQGQKVDAHIEDGKAYLNGFMNPYSIAGFLAARPASLGRDFHAFLENQAELHTSGNFSNLKEEAIEIPKPYIRTEKIPKDKIPNGMAFIPGGTYELKTETRLRECGFYQAEGIPPLDMRNQKLHETLSFQRTIEIQSFAIDIAPVTNTRFFQFMKETNHQPDYSEHFLEHWKDSEKLKAKREHPVVHISMEDAEAYAQWAGKRLPTEEEWQIAAQGPKGLRYPWGSDMQPNRCNDGSSKDTTAVTAFPLGLSPFGCYDMCGNVWEWTASVRSNGRTRYCILKGGSFFQAKGSEWHADGGPQPNAFAAKYILHWPGADRSEAIGFRCVKDIEDF